MGMNGHGRRGRDRQATKTEQRGFRRAPIAHAVALVLAAGGAMGQAHAAPAFSPAWFAAKAAIQNTAAATGLLPNGQPVSSLTPGQRQAQQASQQVQKSIADLSWAARLIALQQAAQRTAGTTPSNVRDGLGAGGLDPDLSNAWQNAGLDPQNPQSVDSNGHVVVDVKQTGSRAIANWNSFNVGQNTILNFDQSGGTQSNGANNWVILNRINNPNGVPSQILGSITAQGSVYVIDHNGIVFGNGSQINVHSLVASSLDFLNTNDDVVQTPADIAASNALFMSAVGGLAALEAGQTGVGNVGAPNEVLGLGNNVAVPSASQYKAPGDITIEQGASITTHTNGTASDGGLILIAAPNISNAGSITASGGQAILAAGVGLSLRADPGNPQRLIPELTGKISVGNTTFAPDITPVGTLTNTGSGIVQTPLGAINLLGINVIQDGVVGATTSVNTPGSIIISTVDEYQANTPTGTAYPGQSQITTNTQSGINATHRAGQLIFGDNSLTAILADDDGETATSSPGTSFTPGSITMTAGSVWFQNGSLIEAPGANVSVAALTPSSAGDVAPPGDMAAPGRILVDTGATIDVAGLADVQVAVADTLVTIGLIGQNELADSPLLRNSFLMGLKDVVIDSTLSGTRADGTPWVGSPDLNAQGYVDLIPRSIKQLLTNGGSIELSGAQVMTAQGSTLDLDGGFVHYLGGMVKTTVLVDQFGNNVAIGQADPDDPFVGIAGQFTVNHPRWGVTETYQNPLIGRAVYEDDFIVGGNAGTLSIYGSQTVVLDGTMSAQAVAGTKQILGNSQPTGGTFNLGSDPAALNGLADMTLGIDSGVTGESGTVIVQDGAPQLSDLFAAGFSMNTPLDTTALGALSNTDPNNILATTVVPADALASGGFANVNITEDARRGKDIVVAAGSQLTVQPGGSITFDIPGAATVLGNLIAPSGTITITAEANIVVGPDATLSVAGLWVNNSGQIADGSESGNAFSSESDSEFINGGSITLSTAEVGSGNGSVRGDDISGSIDLQAGSLIDVSSGGELQANGQLLMKNGIAAGQAGSLSLITYAGNNTDAFGTEGSVLPQDQPTAGRIEMDGTIDSFGFAGGGTLTLQALGFQIGGDPTQAPSWDLFLPTDFFAEQGFGKYVLNALYDLTVAPGATVALTQRNLIPDVSALAQAASGANLSAGGLTTLGTVDPYFRQATDLVMTAGGYIAWSEPAPSFGAPLPRPVYAGVTGAVTIGEGAAIIGDAGAEIGLGSPAQVTVLGSIIAPGGSITLSADSQIGAADVQSGQSLISAGFTSDSKSVWLGADAVLDVAGVALTDPLGPFVRSGDGVFQADTGRVLAGGSVVISDDSGYVVAQAGAVIDVSGTSATFDAPQAGGQYAPQAVWSDAGAITLAVSSGLYFDGTLRAQPGASQAQGGTLAILPLTGTVSNAQQPGGGTASTPGAQLLILQQSGDLVPAGLAPGQNIVDAVGGVNGQPTGMLQFAADRLTGSGIANLVLGNGSLLVPVAVAFAGSVNLTVSNAVDINANQIVALSSDETAALESGAINPATHNPYTLAALLKAETTASVPTAIGSTVTIDAPYVAIVGPIVQSSAVQLAPVAAVADATLNINASFIDLENEAQLNNFGEANFSSSGDIRLSSTNANISATGSPNMLAPGELYTPGNLSFTAADLYPSTGSTFILDAVGPAGAATTITFLANGASSVPLSAGGTLLVDATNIVQAGSVRAPFGSLVFGVGDTGDAATKTQFNNLPLVDTQSVTLADGSITSVSADGAVIPYGMTVDGVEWQFNPVPKINAAPDMTAPPSKFISVNGSNVALNSGATIDLSGGGDLQAAEWVPGTGGSRDVLAQYNVSFASTASGVAVPTNVGAANVYAILPGQQSPVAAYDPMFAQTLQPSKNANGSVGTTTDRLGVGAAALGDAVGESVYLSNVPGLPAGYYTLLPAKYATLPGAYRVTVADIGGTVAPGEHVTAADGTQIVAGYFGNALDGGRDALPTLFDVQSGAVWKQYSQYTLTSANAFFPTLAANAGSVTPALPMDGGQLVLAATKSLSLGASLNTAAASGGAPAEIDIASQDIQIVGNGEAALPGYLQINADQLDALGAGSLLIGGKRSRTTDGILIDAIANSVVVSNDAADPLTGPEIILVTKTDPTNTDPNAANGLRVDSGSVIAASGDYPANREEPLFIGQAGGASGDGSLLMVSDGGIAVVTRANTSDPTTNAGILTVAADATLDGGAALTLDSSGSLTFDPAASLSGTAIAVDGSEITFTDQAGADAGNLSGFVAGPGQIAQLANAQEVIFRSAGQMNFIGNADITFGNDVDLSAPLFVSDGGAVTITAPVITFSNETGAQIPGSANTNAGSGSLTVDGGEIDFGVGDKALSGFGTATFNASSGIVGQGTGTFDFGAVPVTLNAPIYLADTGSDSTLQTTGALNIDSAAGTALDRVALGGAWSFIGGTVNDNGATIAAPAGNLSLEATTGDVTIADGSLINAGGVALQFFDVTEYAPAGAISLTADTGTVNVQAGSTLDFSGADGGGAAGSLTLSAPDQSVQLAGTIKGNAADGYLGGSFSLTTGGAVDLDNLAMELASSGVNAAISVDSKTGNLVLSAGNTLTAHVVSLTADGGAGGQDPNNGNVDILGTIDASGNAGGEIDLYGKSGVDLEGSLIATGLSATERGGTVNIGTTAIGNTQSINSTYGYEDIAASNGGVITLGGNATIDVSGGSRGGLSNGTVSFRAPIVDDGSGGATVNLTIAPRAAGAGPLINGARSVDLEAYAIWNTDDVSTGDQHFDGIVDPAGWYGDSVAGAGQPGMVDGQWTDQTGAPLSAPTTTDQLATYLANDFFTPTAGMANTDHQGFYGYKNGDATQGAGTLMNFVEHGVQNVASQFAATGFAVVPGIELDNPNTAINDGNISILTNWNLGAGASSTDLAFRFNGQAPIITFRAENNVEVKASLTDGFFQIANPVTKGVSDMLYSPILSCPTSDPSCSFYDLTLDNYSNLAEGEFAGMFAGTVQEGTLAYYGPNGPSASYAGFASAPVKLTVGDPQEIAQYYELYTAYADFLLAQAVGANPGIINVLQIAEQVHFGAGGSVPTPPPAPSATVQATNPVAYLEYLQQYAAYLVANLGAAVALPSPPIAEPVAVIPPGTALPSGTPGISGGGTSVAFTTPTPADNSPSPVATAANPLPLPFASLNSGTSSSFRLVAGANLNSANPLALQAAALFAGSPGTAAGEGNVVLDGHFAYDNANNPGDANDLSLLAPTMIRTGSGSIDIAAGNDVTLADTTAPGVIYTAGVPAAGAPAVGDTETIVLPGITAAPGTSDILVTPAVNPDAAGDISIVAQNNITGIQNVIDQTGAVSGVAGQNITQYWWQWMQVAANPSVVFNQNTDEFDSLPITRTSIDFGAFDQGVMSVGGNVSV
jgi:filamentous hemagglutinin family protein